MVVVVDVLMSFDLRRLLENFKAEIKKLLQVKLLGVAKSFIGLEIILDEWGVMFGQTTYIEKIL